MAKVGETPRERPASTSLSTILYPVRTVTKRMGTARTRKEALGVMGVDTANERDLGQVGMLFARPELTLDNCAARY